MITDDQTQDKGFAARWDTVCGQNYQHEPQGILENGNFTIYIHQFIANESISSPLHS